MRMHRNQATDLLELKDGDTTIPTKFKRVSAGLGWLEVSEGDTYSTNWCILIGEKEDGRYSFIAEASGEQAELTDELINMKDRFLVDRVYLDGEEEESLRALRQTDGLCRYFSAGKDVRNREMWEHKSDYWPEFRSRETVCSIIPVPVSVRVDLRAGLELIRRLVFTKKRAAFGWNTVVFESLLYQNPPYDKVLKHPLMKAAIYCLSMLERTKPRDTSSEKQRPPVYGNLR